MQVTRYSIFPNQIGNLQQNPEPMLNQMVYTIRPDYQISINRRVQFFWQWIWTHKRINRVTSRAVYRIKTFFCCKHISIHMACHFSDKYIFIHCLWPLAWSHCFRVCYMYKTVVPSKWCIRLRWPMRYKAQQPNLIRYIDYKMLLKLTIHAHANGIQDRKLIIMLKSIFLVQMCTLSCQSANGRQCWPD